MTTIEVQVQFASKRDESFFVHVDSATWWDANTLAIQVVRMTLGSEQVNVKMIEARKSREERLQ
jgi:hypothetical protein